MGTEMKLTTNLAILASAALMAASPVVAQDWNGFYAGLAAGRVNGDWAHFSSGGGSPFNDGAYSSDTIAGAFLGYNYQSGAMVYGGELALSGAGDLCFEEYPTECTDNFVDLKGRVGYASGSALFYGVLGLSRAKYDYSDVETFTLSGYSYGIGVDYAFQGQYFVGGEILRRDGMDNDDFFGDSTEHDLTSVTIRFGMNF
jgi:outer membrane immunogenic protein